MTSFELLEILDRFTRIVADHRELVDSIKGLAAAARETSQIADQLALLEDVHLVNVRNAARQRLQGAIDLIRSLPHANLFPEIRGLKADFESLANAAGQSAPETLAILSQDLTQFSRAYESAIRTYSHADAMVVIVLAKQIDRLLGETAMIIGFIEARLSAEPVIPDGYADLTLFMGASGDLEDLSAKLALVNHLYEQICELTKVSLHEFPLIVVRVEAGSLFLKVLGNSAAIKIVGDLIDRAASYFYRKYTIEGKIEGVPHNVKSS